MTPPTVAAVLEMALVAPLVAPLGLVSVRVVVAEEEGGVEDPDEGELSTLVVVDGAIFKERVDDDVLMGKSDDDDDDDGEAEPLSDDALSALDLSDELVVNAANKGDDAMKVADDVDRIVDEPDISCCVDVAKADDGVDGEGNCRPGCCQGCRRIN